MLIRISRFLLLLIIVIACAHFLPKLYWMKFEKSIQTPFVAYSPVVNDFIISSESSSDLKWKDSKGNYYGREEFDSLLPFMNYRQLAATEKMPEVLNGIKISLEDVRLNNFMYRITPSAIDYEEIPLYSMLESQSRRVNLAMPKDFFRIKKRIEFIDSETNEIDEEKSILFTNELLTKGFSFPAKLIAGNPTTRKPFDEGYFVIDNKNNLFHIKMVKGKPFCVNTNIPANMNIVYIAAIEMNLREFYAYIVTEDNKIFLLSYDNYKPIELPVINYNYKSDNLRITGDLFYRTISVYSYDNVEVFVTDRQYNLIDIYKEIWQGKYESNAGVVSNYLFPFSINFSSNKSSFNNLFVRLAGFESIFLLLACAVIAAGLIRYRKESFKKSFADLLLVLFTGIYGLIAIIAIKNVE